MRLLPVVGDTLLDPFEARNTDLSLRLAVRVEAEAVAVANTLQAKDLFIWVGKGEPAVTAPGGGCPVGVEFVGYRWISNGESASASASTVDGNSSQAPIEQNRSWSGPLNQNVFQPSRPGIGGAAGFEASVTMSLERSADGW
jgi:hypothetical protein